MWPSSSGADVNGLLVKLSQSQFKQRRLPLSSATPSWLHLILMKHLSVLGQLPHVTHRSQCSEFLEISAPHPLPPAANFTPFMFVYMIILELKISTVSMPYLLIMDCAELSLVLLNRRTTDPVPLSIYAVNKAVSVVHYLLSEIIKE